MAERIPPAVPEGCRRGVAIAVVIAVGAMHVLNVGALLPTALRPLYSGYASDVLLPFAMFFVCVLAERNLGPLANGKARAAAVFAAAAGAEVLQGMGVPALGRTFDPLDFAMYALGVLAAVLLERVALPAWCRRLAAARSRS